MNRGRMALLVAGVVAATAFVSGCATTLTPTQTEAFLTPIITATTGDPTALRATAQSGDARGQYVLSLVVGHGLNGEPVNAAEAAEWRRKAVARRGFTPITTYIPGLKGKPGRVMINNIPRYGYQPYEAALVDRCVAVLAASADLDPGSPARDFCGGLEAYARLKRLWDAAGR